MYRSPHTSTLPLPPYLIYVQFQSETSLLCCTMSGSNSGVIQPNTFEAHTDSRIRRTTVLYKLMN